MKILIDGVEVEKFAIQDGSDGSQLVTIHLPPKKIKGPWPSVANPNIHKCLACMIESDIGSEETPHPIPERWHTC